MCRDTPRRRIGHKIICTKLKYFVNNMYIHFIEMTAKLDFQNGNKDAVVACLPRTMEGMRRLQFSDLITELPGVVGTFKSAFYIILSTTVSFFNHKPDAILFFYKAPFLKMLYVSCNYQLSEIF